MKIGFDARMIDHPGIGRYIKSLLTAMTAVAGDSEFILFGDTAKLSDFKDCEKKEYTIPIYSFGAFFTSPFEKDEFDIIHMPHFNATFRKKNRLVITIHDLIYLKFSESRPYFIPNALVKRIVSNATKRASKIIAVSDNTKKDIIENFPDAKGKVEVIYEAADPIFRKIDDEKKKEVVREKYNLPKDIILSVGSLKRHKNIERLIDAYSDLKSKGVQHRLVIVGRYRPREAEILKKIKTTDALYLGEVPSEDLVVIYNLTTLMVIPSLYEGFGLPALEAMACGVPVAASSLSSLPEVIGDAGILFNPYDTKSISDKIYEILKNKALRQDLIEKGLSRASTFSWEKAARQTMEVYSKAVSSQERA